MNRTIIPVEMILAARKIVLFMETRDAGSLSDIFAPTVVIMDSFFPYIFEGQDAVDNWAKGFTSHAKNLTELRHSFGDPQEFTFKGNKAFISIPVTWEGKADGVPFYETGGMALVFINIDGCWKIQNYAWAATSFKN